jgi:hypothetical protein
MPQYKNPPGPGPGTTVDITHHAAPYGPSGTHSIRCSGTGPAAATHFGYLDYSVDDLALCIHTIDVTPEGSGLGSLLLFEADQIAVGHLVNRFMALNVAATARGFYLRSSFHPCREGRQQAEALVQTPAPMGPNHFGLRLALARGIGNWDGDRMQIKAAAFAAIDGRWM